SQTETAGAMLPRPTVVIVEDFTVSPDEVKLDEGVSGEVRRIVEGGHAPSRTEQELDAGRQVADAIANNLVVEIRDMGRRADPRRARS
ncbi:MAG: hypothetical protein ACREH6_10965, partial [Geminicoccaceae bacterium]